MSETQSAASDGWQYLLGHSPAEDERLRQQPRQLGAEAGWLLDQLGIRPGWRAIDVGCGAQGVVDLLAERVGPRGSVVGLDRSESAVALARRFVAEHNLVNVEVVLGDARATGLPRASFDVAHLRLVLVNVPNPREIVAELVALVRPGGSVAIHEADWAGYFCEPAHPAGERLLEAFHCLARERGIDLSAARRVPAWMRQAGLVDVRVRPVVHVYPLGHPRRPIFPQFVENVREGLIGRGLLTAGELDDLLAGLGAHLDDPDTLVVSHLFLQAWGRKP